MNITPSWLLFFWPVLTIAAPSVGEEAWVPLLDETSFQLWKNAGESPADFQLVNGVVIGKPIGQNPSNAFLCSSRTYQDFELRFSFRISQAAFNSGVQFRSYILPDGKVAGPQLEMYLAEPEQAGFFKRRIIPWLGSLVDRNLQSQGWPTGAVYGENLDTGWLFPSVEDDWQGFAAQGQRLTDASGWNELKLEAMGARIRTWQAGELRADFERQDAAGAGLICLQIHGGHYEDPSQYTVEWKYLEIREY